jgi:membrane associated rhomboid family serine protease
MTPWVLRLIVANAIIHLAIQTGMFPIPPGLLVLRPVLLLVRPWTLITYMFLHGSLGHVFFNMLALYFFGSRVELRIGGRHFILLYLVSGMAGGLLSLVFSPTAPIVGASGAVYGISLAFAYFWPRERIFIWGVVPVEARILVIAYAAIDLFGGISGARTGIAHFAHLGGYVGGWAYLWLMTRRTTAGRRAWQTRVNAPAGVVDSRRIGAIDVSRIHPVNRDEVNRILDKIRTSGLDSLTNQERTFLSHFAGPEAGRGTDAPRIQ